MRTLKFRAYDSATGKVSEPFDVKESWGDYLIDFEDYSTDGALDSIIWEQFTGLLDRNGKEIYEGDIFRNAINGGTWRVYWNEKDAAFWVDSGVAGCSLGDFDWDRSNREYGFIEKNCEVIGNVHENPELLEEKLGD